VDIVTDPSGPDCFVNGIMENTDFYLDLATGTYRAAQVEQVVEEIKAEVRNTITRTVRRIDENQAVRLFQKFVRNLSEDLTNADFQKDLAAVKAGKADPSAMAEKWGARGGAFLNFIRPSKSSLKTKS
jgi:hypothetical protein